MPRNCTVFLLPRRLTRSAIYGSQKENHAISRQTCVDHCILLLKHLSNHMHFIKKTVTNAFYRPTRPIQGKRVPLMVTVTTHVSQF